MIVGFGFLGFSPFSSQYLVLPHLILCLARSQSILGGLELRTDSFSIFSGVGWEHELRRISVFSWFSKGAGVMESFRDRVWFVMDLSPCGYGSGVIHGFILDYLLLRSQCFCLLQRMRQTPPGLIYAYRIL